MGDPTNPTAWAFFDVEARTEPPPDTAAGPAPVVGDIFFDLGGESEGRSTSDSITGPGDFFDPGVSAVDSAGADGAGGPPLEDDVWDVTALDATEDEAADEAQFWFDQEPAGVAGWAPPAEAGAFFDAGFDATEAEMAGATDDEPEPQSLTEVPEEISRDDLRRAGDSYTTASHFNAGMTYTMNNLFHH